MSKQAEGVFFSEAYHNGETERSNWQREVLRNVLSSMTENGIIINGRNIGDSNFVAKLERLQEELDNYELTLSNDLTSEIILMCFLQNETNEEVKELVLKSWVGLWDSPSFINACVNKQDFYDGSYLVKYTSEFQILLRKVTELFCTLIFTLDFAEDADKVLESFAQMLAIELHDIEFDEDEIGINAYLSLFPTRLRDTYEEIFQKCFFAGCMFIIFHEIGHKIEVNEGLARLYNVNPSIHLTDQHKKELTSEYNADLISMKIIDSIFGQNEAIDWLGYAGILLCIMTLAIKSKNLTIDTNHPSIQKRYICAKDYIQNKLGDSSERVLFRRLNAVGIMLSSITKWEDNEWWNK